MNSLTVLGTAQLYDWIEQAQNKAKMGKIPQYIPLLTSVNPENLILQIISLKSEVFSYGDQAFTFPLMSVIKPFVLLYCLSNFGSDFVFKRVGKDPSQYPFNSLDHQFNDEGIPKNPMINSGAITLASLLPGENSLYCCENLRFWLNNYGNCELYLDKSMLADVQRKRNEVNYAIACQLADRGYVENPEIALNTYEHICCLSGTIIDLARLGLILVNCPESLKLEHCLIVLELMKTCGLYEASQDFAERVGFPTKSGVSGGVLSLVPGQGAIACYSPRLDDNYNSIAGLFLVEQIAQKLRLNINQ